MTPELPVLEQLQQWYLSNCNEDWEHTYGVVISNIDNPGWSVKIELFDTYLYGIHFDEIKLQREQEDNWIICSVIDGVFQGYGGPNNLTEILKIFLDWDTRSKLAG